ncbi:hypothetical protein F2Q69_00030687 [Brassica cretica]|uniref:Uncharacterized protein n=1 Tax=Brassica cretica TaxID=69181 RepID=A0A8S9S2S2_BRACR|nr:hypothetical protein F2Q69_00030687 [Brassica cretica]
MLLPPLYLLGLALVSAGNFTDLGCRLRLLRLCSQSLGDFEQSNLYWRLISGAPVMTSSIMTFTMESAFKDVHGIPEVEEARGYALTTTTKTKRLEGLVTDAGTPV